MGKTIHSVRPLGYVQVTLPYVLSTVGEPFGALGLYSERVYDDSYELTSKSTFPTPWGWDKGLDDTKRKNLWHL